MAESRPRLEDSRDFLGRPVHHVHLNPFSKVQGEAGYLVGEEQQRHQPFGLAVKH